VIALEMLYCLSLDAEIARQEIAAVEDYCKMENVIPQWLHGSVQKMIGTLNDMG